MSKRKYFSPSNIIACLIIVLGGVSSIVAGDTNNLLQATYSSEYSGMDIKVTRTLQELGQGQYSYRFDADSTVAGIYEESIFAVEDTIFKPLNYTYERTVFGIRKKENLVFDWQNKQAIYYKKSNRSDTHALTDALTLDSSLYQLQLQKDLYNNAKQLHYTYIQRGKIRQREFRVVKDTSFNLSGKSYPAKLLRRVSENNEKVTEVIVIPELMYIIAQIEQTEDGTTYNTQLTHLSMNADKLAKLYRSE